MAGIGWIVIVAASMLVYEAQCGQVPACSTSHSYDNLEMPIYEFVGNETVWSPCHYPSPQATKKTCRKLNPCALPNPSIQWRACRRSVKSWVCDPDKLLTVQQGDELNKILDQKSYCRCKEVCSKEYRANPIVVLLAKRIHIADTSGLICTGGDCGELYPQLNPTGRAPTPHEIQVSADNFTALLIPRWDLGRCGDGVVVLYVAEHNRLSVAAGDLAYSKLGEIFESAQTTALTRISESHLYGALHGLVTEYTEKIFPKNSQAFIIGVTVGVIAGLLLFFGLVMTIVFCRRERDQGKTCSQVCNSCIGGESAILYGGTKHHMVPAVYEKDKTDEEL